MQCDENVAERQCLMCENSHFCKTCYVQAHIAGTKRRHMYFDITYDKDLVEGPSTWAQPVIPERENSFLLVSEYESDVSSESFERAPMFNAAVEYDHLSQF